MRLARSEVVDAEPAVRLVLLDEEKADVVVRGAVGAAHRNVEQAVGGTLVGKIQLLFCSILQ